MFEQPQPKARRPVIRILVPVAVVFSALLAAVVLRTRTGTSDDTLPGIVRGQDSEFSWYAPSVEIESGDIKMGKNFAGHRVVIFSGVINNRGEKTLDVVEVKLTLFNYDDPVFEATRIPIRPGGYTPPIRPLSNRPFTLYLEDIPGHWLASHAEMELHGFRFQEP